MYLYYVTSRTGLNDSLVSRVRAQMVLDDSALNRILMSLCPVFRLTAGLMAAVRTSAVFHSRAIYVNAQFIVDVRPVGYFGATCVKHYS